MSSSSMKIREPHVQAARSQSAPAKTHRRLIGGVQVMFFLFGLAFMVIGGARVGVDLFGRTNPLEISGYRPFELLRAGMKRFTPEMLSIPTLTVGILALIVGYWLLWSIAAIGAKEPPAWHVGRNGLIAILIMLFVFIGIASWLDLSALIICIPATFIVGIPLIVALTNFGQPSVRFILGADRLQKREAARFNWIRNGFIVLVLSTMLVLGGVYVVLTDIIELPLSEVDPGQLIFVTTFDDYNDEWDVYPGRNSSEILPDENENSRLVVNVNSGIRQDGVYSLLNRKIRDFDLRVTTAQLASDPVYDNRYGVVFRYRDKQNYYAFEISGDGWYRVIKVEEGDVEEISAWMPTTLVNHETVVAGFDTWVTGAALDDQQLQEILRTWATTSGTELNDDMLQRVSLWISTDPTAGDSVIEMVRAWLADPEARYGYDSQDEVGMIKAWIELSAVSGQDYMVFPTLIRPGRHNRIDIPSDAMNQVRVVGYDDKFWFYVNGQRLKLCQAGDSKESTFSGGVCISDELTDYFQDDTFKQGQIGLLAGYTENSDLEFPVTVAFDNLVILGPDPDLIDGSEEQNVSESTD